MEKKQGTKEWFEYMCDPAQADRTGDRWGVRWRGYHKLIHARRLDLLRTIITKSNHPLNILDIGCAFGDFTEKVWRLNSQNRINGVDISENAIDVVSKKYPQMQFKLNALPSLDFPDGSFDVVICLEVLYYLNRDLRAKALSSIKRVLKQSGYFLISGPLDGGKKYFNKREILDLLSSQGFEFEKIKYGYDRLYLRMEQRLLTARTSIIQLKEISEMPKKKYMSWLEGKPAGRKYDLVNRCMGVIRSTPFGQELICRLLQFTERILTSLISNMTVPLLFSRMTRILLRKRAVYSIEILAKKNNVHQYFLC